MVNFYKGAPFSRLMRETGDQCHDNYVNCVRFSPDGKYAASAGSDKKVIIYDGKTGEVEVVLPIVHKGSIYGIDWSSDSKQIVTCSADKKVRVISVPDGNVVREWDMSDLGRGGMQVGVVYMPSEEKGGPQKIVSVSLRGHLNVFHNSDAGAEGPALVVRGHKVSVTCMAADPRVQPAGTTFLYTGATDGSVCATHLGGTDAVPLPAPLRGGEDDDLTDRLHAGRVRTVDLLPGATGHADVLVTTGWDDVLRVSAVPPSPAAVVAVPLGFQPTASGSGAGTVLVVSATGILAAFGRDGSPRGRREGLPYGPTCADVAPDGSAYAVGGDDGTLRIYATDLGDGATEVHRHVSPVSAVSYSRDGALLASADAKEVTVWDVANGYRPVILGKWQQFHTGSVSDLAWHQDGAYLASGGMDGHIIIWSIAKDNKRVRYNYTHRDGVSALEWGEGGLASAGVDGVICLWDVEQDMREKF